MPHNVNRTQNNEKQEARTENNTTLSGDLIEQMLHTLVKRHNFKNPGSCDGDPTFLILRYPTIPRCAGIYRLYRFHHHTTYRSNTAGEHPITFDND